MEKGLLLKFGIYGFFFIAVLGTLLHFTYEWSCGNKFIAIFGAVNESTWEHIKMAIFPAFFWMALEYSYISNTNNLAFAKLLSMLTMIITILILYYAYRYIAVKNILFIDILIFYVAIAIGQYVSYKIMSSKTLSDGVNSISIMFLVILCIIFLLFTYITPKLKIFKDPVTGGYGIIDLK